MSTINAIASGLTSESDATTNLILQTNNTNAVSINGSQIVTINNNTNSSSTSTGALVVTGGLGVGGNIYASGSVYAVDFVATGNATFGNDGTDSITIGGFFVDGTKLRTATSNGNSYALSAYDVNDTTYRDLITLTAGNTPTVTITSNGLGSVDNMTIGGSTPAAGTFTQLTRSGNLSTTAWTTSGIGFRSSSAIFTDTSSTGTVPVTTINTFNQHTLASSNSVTVTDAATVYIADAPLAGTNTTITNRNALYVAAGISRFLGAVTINGANVSTTISPTGTGTVTINPATAGTINNMSVGNLTPSTGVFTQLTRSGDISTTAWTTSGIGFRGIASTFTDTSSSGTVPVTTINTFNQHTLASSNSVTVTDAATVYIANGPAAGTNTTITNRNALYVAAGISRFLGDVSINGANVSTTISPTGTGTVTINPATAGTINNMSVGASTPSTGTFTQLTRSGDISAAAWTTSGIGYRGIASTFTDTTSTGTVAVTTINTYNQHTLASTNTITVTDAATVYIANGPTAGTNTTITNRNALYVAAGISRFLGAVTINGSNVSTTISPTGTGTVTINPATAGTMNNVTLTVPAGTTSIAPVRLTSGTNLSAVTAGAMEYDGTVITFTSNTNIGRVPLLQGAFTSGISGSNGVTVVALTNYALFPAANDTITLPVGSYMVEVNFRVDTNAAVSNALIFSILGAGGATCTFNASAITTNTTALPAATSTAWITSQTGATITAAVATAAQRIVTIKGVLRVTVQGTIIPSVQFNGAAGTMTFYADNYMMISPLTTAAATASTGGWA